MAQQRSLKNIMRLIEVANNELPVNQAFVADLKMAIEKTEALNKRNPSRTYKPSSMKCIRNMYFQVIGTPQDVSDANACLVGICETGSDRHERIQKAIDGMYKFGAECEYIDVAEFIKQRKLTHLNIVSKQGMETKLFYPELNMSFLCDGIIKYCHQYYILEIKTETIHKWQNRADVADEHIPQGVAYSVAFGIDKVMFLYENRDNCDKKAYLLEVTPEMKMDLIGKITLCDEYRKTFTIPPFPEDVDKRTCAYCNYKESCRKAGK